MLGGAGGSRGGADGSRGGMEMAKGGCHAADSSRARTVTNSRLSLVAHGCCSWAVGGARVAVGDEMVG